ncbi:MAG: hypothetical protein EOP49_52615 [Sphingobacteriales bacterium]|nr:MAG: hypothetical protein EOP49_52615 [Sphingobacteriales bacterium]
MDERTQAISHAIDELKHAVLAGRYAIPWIVRVKPEFLGAVRDGDAVARAVFMQWGVLLDQFHELWWASFAGKLLVEEIACTLDQVGDGWEEITKWSREQAGLCS